jgi:hypothetical protein
MNELVKSGFLNEIFTQREDLILDYDFRNPASGTNYIAVPFGTNQTTYLSYNLEVPTGDQYGSNKVIDTGHPALAYTDSAAPNDAIVSGEFDGNTKCRVLGDYTGSDWTFYVAFQHSETGLNSNSKVLLSNKTGINCTSGFAFGINGCNRLFFEHEVSSDEKRVYTFNKELDNKNLASLSKINSNIYVGLHQYEELNSYSAEEIFEISGYSPAYSFYLGGLATSGQGYSNFSGYVDQFMILAKGLEFPERNTFAEAFYCSGYDTGTLQTTFTTSNAVTGLSYQNTIVGTGITGYEEYLKGYEEINGENVAIYGYSGVTGDLYEERVVELTGSVQASVPTTTFLNASGIPDYSYAMEFSNSKILSFNNFDDSYKEVYSFSGENDDDVNLNSAFIDANGKFSIFPTGSGETVNLYVNGLLEPFVSSLNSSYSGEFKLSGVYINSDNFFDRDDVVSYDIINGSMSSGEVTSAEETAGLKYLSYAIVSDKDLYLNGVKLISGVDFTDVSTGVKIQFNGLSEGQLLFAPKHEMNLTRFTGLTDNNFDTSVNLFDEEVWVNGLKQNKYLDYEKLANFSMKYSSFSLEPLTNTVYNNDTGYFNV